MQIEIFGDLKNCTDLTSHSQHNKKNRFWLSTPLRTPQPEVNKKAWMLFIPSQIQCSFNSIVLPFLLIVDTQQVIVKLKQKIQHAWKSKGQAPYSSAV